MKASAYSYVSYRDFIRDKWEARKTRATRPLSLRAFSRLIGVSPSALSNVLSGKREFSSDALLQISNRLGLSELEQEHILALKSLEDGQEVISTSRRPRLSKEQRPGLRKHLEARARAMQKTVYSGKDAAFLSAWYVLPFIEALNLASLKQDLKAISERLGVNHEVLERLQTELASHGVIERGDDGVWRKVGSFLQVTSNGEPHHAARRFHRQMLGVALEKITEETTHERYLGSETFGFKTEQLPEARAIIDRCLDELASLAGKCDDPTTIYHAGIQLFQVLNKKRPSNE